MIAAFMLTFFYGVGQTFEGEMKMHVSIFPDNLTSVKVNGRKSITEYQIDTTENIKIIKDAATETQTILRHKGDMKYGFITTLYEEDTTIATTHENNSVECKITSETKVIDGYKSSKAVLQNGKAVAEAWITKDLGFPVSKYFPNFIGDGTDPLLLDLRKQADRSGFILEYRESLISVGDETLIQFSVEEKNIPIEAFAIHGYHVYDKDGLSRLLSEGYQDPNKKKQWEEFRQLFGKKD